MRKVWLFLLLLVIIVISILFYYKDNIFVSKLTDNYISLEIWSFKLPVVPSSWFQLNKKINIFGGTLYSALYHKKYKSSYLTDLLHKESKIKDWFQLISNSFLSLSTWCNVDWFSFKYNSWYVINSFVINQKKQDILFLQFKWKDNFLLYDFYNTFVKKIKCF